MNAIELTKARQLTRVPRGAGEGAALELHLPNGPATRRVL